MSHGRAINFVLPSDKCPTRCRLRTLSVPPRMQSPPTERPTESEIPLRISMSEIAIIAHDLAAASKPPLGGASPQREAASE